MRNVKNWTPSRVEDSPVAEHRYLWSGTVDAAGRVLPDTGTVDTWDEFKPLIPYAVGEVVWVEHRGSPRRARILHVMIEWDSFGSLREFYRVQLETKAGLWSRTWVNKWPGDVQRGYFAAGLAPDLEGKV